MLRLQEDNFCLGAQQSKTFRTSRFDTIVAAAHN